MGSIASPTRSPSYWLSTAVGLTLFSTVIVLTWLLTDLSADPDLFARLAVGRLIESLGYVPLHDPFSFAPKKPIWIDHEWLAGVIFHCSWRWLGEPGLFLLKGIFMVLSLAALERAQRVWAPESRGRAIWFVLLVLGSAVVWRSTVRSQIFTYLGIPWCLLAFAEYQRLGRRGLLYLLPLYFVVWANAHGGFVVGLGFLGIFAVVESLRRRRAARAAWIALAGSLVATLLNPYPGFSYWEYVLHAVTLTREYVPEWQSVALLSHTAVLPLLVAGIAVGGWVRGPRPELLSVALLAVSFCYGMKHERLVPIFLMTAVVFAAPAWSSLMRTGWDRLSTVRRQGFAEALAFVALLIALAAGSFSLYTAATTRLALRYDDYPVAAVDWVLANREAGRVVTTFNDGSYALWRLYPRFQIAVDGRYEELYPDSTLRAVMDIYWGDKREQGAALELLQPDLVLVESAAVTALQREGLGSWGVEAVQLDGYEIWEFGAPRGDSLAREAPGPPNSG